MQHNSLEESGSFCCSIVNSSLLIDTILDTPYNVCSLEMHITYTQIRICINIITPEFLISFEARAKLAQQRIVYVPLGIRLEPINKELMLLVLI